MELKKLKRKKYFTKALLELRAWGFSEEEVNNSSNITLELDKLIVWHRELHTYREDDVLYKKLNTGHPDMEDKGEIGAIGVKGGVTDSFVNVLKNKNSHMVLKKGKNI